MTLEEFKEQIKEAQRYKLDEKERNIVDKHCHGDVMMYNDLKTLTKEKAIAFLALQALIHNYDAVTLNQMLDEVVTLKNILEKDL
jgi:uncharacterized pyridoxamine 5'-phosphate oxidase family protein